MSFLLLLFSCGKDDNEQVKKSDKALITSFKIGSSVGTIKDNSIKVNVPFGTDISKLKAVVKISPKATIDPDPSKDNDYRSPVTFKVTAEDGTTTKTYKVQVSVEDAIISWTGGWRDDDAFTATITGDKIRLDVNSADFDTKVTLSQGVTISPDPQTIQDWTT